MTDASLAPLLISQPASGSTVTTERYPARVALVAIAVVFLVLFLLGGGVAVLSGGSTDNSAPGSHVDPGPEGATPKPPRKNRRRNRRSS